MGTTFPKDIMDCMKGCILSIFWPKKDIVDFMKKVGCTSRELMPESEYKELHRAEIVDKIFTNLEKKSDSGLQNKAGKTKTRRTGKKAERYQH